MSEKLQKIRKPVALGAAVLALATGASEAKAAPQPPRESMEQVSQLVESNFESGYTNPAYRGKLSIFGPDGKLKVAIKNPIMWYRYGAKNHEQAVREAQHPGNKDWAAGYIKTINGESRVVMLPHNSNGNRFVFTPTAKRQPGESVMFPVRFALDANGHPDLAEPEDYDGKPIVDQEGSPLSIGQTYNNGEALPGL